VRESDRQTRFSSVAAARELDTLGFKGTAKTKSVPPWVFGLTEELRLGLLRGFLDADGSVDTKGRISYSSCNKTLLSQIRHLCMGCGVPVTNMRNQIGSTTLPNGEEVNIDQCALSVRTRAATPGSGAMTRDTSRDSNPASRSAARHGNIRRMAGADLT
jgi:hypothetical protein